MLRTNWMNGERVSAAVLNEIGAKINELDANASAPDDRKLDKQSPSVALSAYSVTSAGVQQTTQISSSPGNTTIAYRGTGGTLQVGTPTAENHAVTKGYVDSGFALTGPIRHARYASNSRPAASSAGSGAQIWDTGLNKPLWSDGTAWRDASGATV